MRPRNCFYYAILERQMILAPLQNTNNILGLDSWLLISLTKNLKIFISLSSNKNPQNLQRAENLSKTLKNFKTIDIPIYPQNNP